VSDKIDILNYGGGRQTIALCILVATGKYRRPDKVLIADTGREAQSTWDYLDTYVRPLMTRVGLEVEIAPHSLATVDLYGHNGDLLLPVYTETGKFKTYCSNEWKASVIQRYLRSQDITEAYNWIGYACDEASRINKDKTQCWTKTFPLIEMMLTKQDCMAIIERAGYPLPPKSSCFMCPHRSNEEWRLIRDKYPAQFAEAIRIDNEIREEDEQHGVFLHQDRVPLAEADLERPDRREPDRQCGLGWCMT
jgi:3'-phosphoadenosine 5'-phosphosulfate sulfotransferase (PAPS reductase)/FAD synthetase